MIIQVIPRAQQRVIYSYTTGRRECVWLKEWMALYVTRILYYFIYCIKVNVLLYGFAFSKIFIEFLTIRDCLILTFLYKVNDTSKFAALASNGNYFQRFYCQVSRIRTNDCQQFWQRNSEKSRFRADKKILWQFVVEENWQTAQIAIYICLWRFLSLDTWRRRQFEKHNNYLTLNVHILLLYQQLYNIPLFLLK